jgi:hypothetical protein
MIHYVDVSGSMTDKLLIEIAYLLSKKRCKIGDRIFTLSGSLEEIPLRQFGFIQRDLLHASNRYGGFRPEALADKINSCRSDRQELRVLYTDGELQPEWLTEEVFSEVFIVPACPICSCSCPIGVNDHVRKTTDAEHSMYLIHNDV